MHAVIHALVEDQIDEAHGPVVRAMTRLTSAALSRHDAIHAVGSISAEHIFDLRKDTPVHGKALDTATLLLSFLLPAVGMKADLRPGYFRMSPRASRCCPG
ncbi:MAG: hypothetical protein ABI178_03530 [Rhodanobacter sp.]